MINTCLKVCYVTPLIMGSSFSNHSTKIRNPKPIHVHPKYVLGECIFKHYNIENFVNHRFKMMFVYVINDEIHKDIRNIKSKNILEGDRNEWYLRTYIPVEKEDIQNWYTYQTTNDKVEEVVTIYKLNNFSYHISNNIKSHLIPRF